MFLSKLNNSAPTEILTDPDWLLKIMREEYVAHQCRTESIETRLEYLESQSQNINQNVVANTSPAKPTQQEIKTQIKDKSDDLILKIRKLSTFIRD